MKLRCKHDHVTKTKGIINRVEYQELVPGLTLGKIYTGQFIAIADNITFNNATQINIEDYSVIIYNDKGEWETYNPNLFEPV